MVDTEARRLALGLAAVLAVVDLELVILGGGVGCNADLLLEPVERELRVLSPLRPRLATSALGENAVLQGRSPPRWPPPATTSSTLPACWTGRSSWSER